MFESGLVGGSQNDTASQIDGLVKVESSFTLSALDGLHDSTAITFAVTGKADSVLSKADVEALSTTPQTISTEYGDLVLNGYTLNADGTITIDYEYTLTSSPDNSSGNGESIDDTIKITVNDRDTDSATQDLVIRIMDDVPLATDDANSITEDEVSVAGNVMGGTGAATGDVADTQGADGATVTGVQAGTVAADEHVADGNLATEIAGKYGTLTLNADGTYNYELDSANLVIQGLGPDQTLEDEVFSYTITDSDGDQSTATLTITINGSNDGVIVNVPIDHYVPVDPDGKPTDPTDYTKTDDHVVFESGLADGSSPGAEATKVASSFTLTALDGLAADDAVTITYDGGELTLTKTQVEALGTTPQTISTPYGDLVLNGYSQDTDPSSATFGTITIDYNYTLNTAPTVPGDATNDEFSIVVKDKDIDHDAGTISIKIMDDAPVAVDDVNSVAEDATAPVAGNVFGSADASAGDVEDTQGADGATVTGVQAGTVAADEHVADGNLATEIAGKYGTLILNADGTYSYELDSANLVIQGLGPDQMLEDEVFSYTITDSDGDQSTATLTITINGSNDGVIVNVPIDHDVPVDPDGKPTDSADYIKTDDHVVFESGLTGGSNPDAEATKVVSSFTLTALDGLAADDAVTITYSGGGLTLSKAQVEALGTTPQTISTPYGDLVLNGYSQDTDPSSATFGTI
ncbi:MAG TPA: hypothetical protein GX719_13865, partial [Gammaproteobacteria bacterium]|nr:hypothetical protein [Gammaproteobacteria bacterium]